MIPYNEPLASLGGILNVDFRLPGEWYPGLALHRLFESLVQSCQGSIERTVTLRRGNSKQTNPIISLVNKHPLARAENAGTFDYFEAIRSVALTFVATCSPCNSWPFVSLRSSLFLPPRTPNRALFCCNARPARRFQGLFIGLFFTSHAQSP